jgi:hypothetical protein
MLPCMNDPGNQSAPVRKWELEARTGIKAQQHLSDLLVFEMPLVLWLT